METNTYTGEPSHPNVQATDDDPTAFSGTDPFRVNRLAELLVPGDTIIINRDEVRRTHDGLIPYGSGNHVRLTSEQGAEVLKIPRTVDVVPNGDADITADTPRVEPVDDMLTEPREVQSIAVLNRNPFHIWHYDDISYIEDLSLVAQTEVSGTPSMPSPLAYPRLGMRHFARPFAVTVQEPYHGALSRVFNAYLTAVTDSVTLTGVDNFLYLYNNSLALAEKHRYNNLQSDVDYSEPFVGAEIGWLYHIVNEVRGPAVSASETVTQEAERIASSIENNGPGIEVEHTS